MFGVCVGSLLESNLSKEETEEEERKTYEYYGSRRSRGGACYSRRWKQH